jgi:DNA-binding transcriptional LysR family regulator
MREDWQALVVFVRTIDAGSFTAAARALATTTSTVSKRIARLEDELGVRLIERTTRRIAVTEAGRVLYEQAARTVRELDAARRSVAELGATPRGLLRVLVDDVLADRAVAPLLPELLQRYPEVRLDIVSGDVDGADLVADGFDVAVRLGATPENSSLRIRRVGAVDIVTCAAPGYLDAAGTPRTVAALAEHIRLQLGSGSAASPWTVAGAAGAVAMAARAQVQLSSIGTVRAAAVAGVGLIRVPRIAVADELHDGRLREVLSDLVQRGVPVQALLPGGRHRAPKAGVFVELLARQLPARLAAPSPGRRAA